MGSAAASDPVGPPPQGGGGGAAAAGPGHDAAAFADLFRAVYLTYHRRDGPRSGLTGASRAVLGHLAHTGPLTIGEAALHLDRAQSVVSEIVDGLERRGLLMRDRDPADRRRTLVWLTPAGLEALRRDAEVLSVEAGRYCTHCTTGSGELQPFDERFSRMVAWQERRHPEQSRADAEAATMAYLAPMPAWRDHPRVAGR